MKKVYLTKSKKDVKRTNKFDLKNKKKVSLSSSKIKGKRWKRKLGKILVIFIGTFFILSAIGGLVVLAYLQDKSDEIPSPENVFPTLPISSEIYDRNAIPNDASGTRLYRIIGNFNSDEVNIEEIPDIVKLAFIAAEDGNFFNHGGFDPAPILRCGIQYIRDTSGSCGASTITQQLVKLTTNRSERALERKIEEILLAIKVEQSYDKEQILEMYLRVTPFGSSIVGVRTAANFYFGKEPKDLTLSEATVLASIIQNPSRLSPTLPFDGNTEVARQKLKERQSYVLGQLRDRKEQLNNDLKRFYNDPNRPDAITDEILETAGSEDWISSLRPPIATDKKAGHFVNYVTDLLTERNYKNGTEPFTISDLQTGGYKIYTTLDYGVQQIAEKYALKGGSDYSFWNVNNSAILTTAPGTGQIIAMAGSKNFYGQKSGCDANGQTCNYDPEVNILTSLQEPGSSNKPLGYYIAFKEGKLFPGSILPDVPIKIQSGGGNYEPRNWDFGYKGSNYTTYQALRDSRNIPAIIAIETYGFTKYIDTARSFGYSSYERNDLGQSVILGGVSVLPVEHAQAYGVFANGGDYVELNPILKIVDRNGEVIYEAKVERKPVGDPQAIYLLNQTIYNYDNYSWDGRQIAGKTGTTQNNMDAWMMAYSPDFVNVCWAGNNNNAWMDQNNGYPVLVVHPWCKAYLSEIGGYSYFSAKSQFQRPSGVYQGGGDCNEEGCLGLTPGWLIEGRTPQRDVKKSKKTVCTDQQDKLARDVDIAMGLSIEKEFNQLKMPVASLQKFLDEYIQKQGSTNSPAPTESCNIDRSGGVTGSYVPILTASSTPTTLNIKGSAFSNTGTVSSLVFSISQDNSTFKVIPGCTITTFPNFDVQCNVTTLNLNSGEAILKIVANDSTGVSNSKNVSINVSSGLSFSQPVLNDTCTNPCARTITGSYNGGIPLTSAQLKVYRNGSYLSNVAINSSTLSTLWNSASFGGTGVYTFSIVGITNAGATLESPITSVSITVN